MISPLVDPLPTLRWPIAPWDNPLTAAGVVGLYGPLPLPPLCRMSRPLPVSRPALILPSLGVGLFNRNAVLPDRLLARPDSN